MYRGLVICLVLINFANGFIGDFSGVDKFGFKSEWDKLDRTYAEYGYDTVYASDKIFVIGQRRLRTTTDAQRPGGIVSIFDMGKRSWWHHPHKLDIGASQYRVFALDSRLHMLTYLNVYNSVHLQKLYAWNHPTSGWIEVHTDASRNVINSNRPPIVHVSVPDQDGKVAYVTASSSINGSNAGLIEELKIQTQNGLTVKATLTQVIRVPHSELKDLIYVTSKDGKTLQAFGSRETRFPPPSSGVYWQVYGRFAIDMPSSHVRYYPLNDFPIIYPNNRNDLVFQAKNRVFFIGTYTTGRGGSVPRIWVIDLNTFQTQSRNIGLNHAPYAIDQKKARLYIVLEDGITALDFLV